MNHEEIIHMDDICDGPVTWEKMQETGAWFLNHVHNAELNPPITIGCDLFVEMYNTFLGTYGPEEDPHDYSFEMQPVHAQKWLEWAIGQGYTKKSNSTYSPPAPAAPVSPAIVETKLPEGWEPVTQKAKGIRLLDKLYLGNGFQTNKHVFVPATHVFAEGDTFNFPLFVRPCPIRPRHGFVDSREVNSREQVLSIMAETLAADPQAEVAFCKKIVASASAILTDGLLVMGPGNDGATSGHEDCVDFPVINMPMVDSIPANVVGEDESPFWEIVYAFDSAKVVQLRSGPKVNYTAGDYIPEDMTVERIYDSRGVTDLIGWEKSIESAPKGSVIYASTMACHFAIHGIVNGVPVITSRVPTLGEKLSKSTESIKALDKQDFRDGFTTAFALQRDSKDIRSHLQGWLNYVLAVMHNSSAFLHLNRSYEIGLAAGLFVRITHALCAGEMRHAPGDGGGVDKGSCRDTIYEEYADCSMEDVEENLDSFYRNFHELPWSGGFGGTAWANVTGGAIDVWNAAIAASPEQALAELNIAVNLAHNNGWFCNKFASHSIMDAAASNPVAFAARYAEAIYSILRTPRVAAGEDFDVIEKVAPKKIPKEVPKRKIVSSHIRSLGDGAWRIQLRFADGDWTEFTVGEQHMTKQAPGLIKKSTATSKSYANSSAMYVPFEVVGIHKKWFTVHGYRVISLETVEPIVGVKLEC